MELLSEDDYNIINTLCGNKTIYCEILIWLKTFNYNLKISKDSCIIVTGKTGIGKTYSINKICSMTKNYEVININNNNCYNSAELYDIIFKSTTSSLIQQLTNNIKKKVIIIDKIYSG